MNLSISQGALGVLSTWKLTPVYFRKVFFFLIIYRKSLSLICFSLISFWKLYLSNAASLDEFSNFLIFFPSHFLFLFLLILSFGEFLYFYILWNCHLCFFLKKIHWIFLSCDHSFFFLTTCSCFWVCDWHSFSFSSTCVVFVFSKLFCRWVVFVWPPSFTLKLCDDFWKYFSETLDVYWRVSVHEWCLSPGGFHFRVVAT